MRFNFWKKDIKTVNLADNSPKAKTDKKRFSVQINRLKPFRSEMEMDILRQAVDAANQKDNPDYRPLLAVYAQTIKDRHLQSQLRTAHNAIQQSEFKIVNENGAEQKDKLKLLQKSWFTDFIAHAIDSEFYGFSLVELYGDGESDEFTNCDLIPRFHVQPATGTVTIDYDKGLKINFRDNLDKLGLIEIGNKDNLGLLELAAVEVIWKLYSRTDWSQHSEKFGMPLLSIKTESVDKKELDAIQDMAENFGANGFVIVNSDDEVTITPPASNSGNSHLIYKDKVAECNSEISKLINGQTMTSDDGSSLSQSEVHERILNSYTKARLMRMQREVNDKLIPYLVENGYSLQGCKIQYKDLENQDVKQTEPVKANETNTEKKKSNLAWYNGIRTIYRDWEDNDIQLAKFKGISVNIFNMVMERLWKLANKSKLPKDNNLVLEAKELLDETVTQLEKGIAEGIKLAKYEPDKVFLQKLKDGVWIFSGLKTQAQLLEATNLLFDETGEIKAWNKFRDDILSIHENYNINYLYSEYVHTISSSQSAVQWQEYQQDKADYVLQYRTAGDSDVRPAHQVLNGITLEIDDPFWNYYYTPNGWKCRCRVIKVLRSRYKLSDGKKAMDAGEASMTVLNSDGTINEKATAKNQIFKFNPGKQEQIFPKAHPYYDLSNKKLDKNINKMK